MLQKGIDVKTKDMISGVYDKIVLDISEISKKSLTGSKSGVTGQSFTYDLSSNLSGLKMIGFSYASVYGSNSGSETQKDTGGDMVLNSDGKSITIHFSSSASYMNCSFEMTALVVPE